MTGVEAVSNGMSAFREPPVKYGHCTLTLMCGILGLLLAGITYLVGSYHIGAMDQTRSSYQSVLPQLAHAVVGQGVPSRVLGGHSLSDGHGGPAAHRVRRRQVRGGRVDHRARHSPRHRFAEMDSRVLRRARAKRTRPS
jgi:hypothetical protein